MVLKISSEPVPLEVREQGVVCVRGSRVTLAAIVTAFRNGATAEEILQRYPTLHLADIYAIVSFYLRHDAEVDSYLSGQQQVADSVRSQNEARFDPSGVRERLLARRGSATRAE